MEPSGCVASKDEQLYTLEIFVDCVSLYAEKLEKIDPGSLGVDLKFTDLPLFRIFQSDFLLTKQERGKEVTRDGRYRTVNFSCGKMNLFTRNAGELVEKMRSKPLLLDVYRIKGILNCPYEVLKEPLGETKIPLPGCICDQVTMAGNDAYHLPKSYVIRNTFGLVDQDRKPSGLIALFVRLTCLGKYVINAFSFVQKKLLFKNAGSFNEFLCTKVSLPDEEDRRAAEAGAKICTPLVEFEESELDAPPTPCNVAGLVLVCQELAKRDGYPLHIIPPNFPRQIPATEVEEKKFPTERQNFEEFKDTFEVQPEVIVERTFYLYQGPCTSTGCAGNVCTGMK